jgi:hypothetical protein
MTRPARAPCQHCGKVVVPPHDLDPLAEAELVKLIPQSPIEVIRRLVADFGWTIVEGKDWVSHFVPVRSGIKPLCPWCGHPLPSALAKQCLSCGMDWHDADHVCRGSEPGPGAQRLASSHNVLAIVEGPVVALPEEIAPAFQAVTILVDGRPFLEMVREAELPMSAQEYQERLKTPGRLETPDSLAGLYGFSNPRWVYLPESHLVPGNRFVDRDGRVSIFECDCGTPGCWPLMARIEADEREVVWRDFHQPHRPNWRYDHFGPFRFRRGEYERALRRPGAL